jgi:hypothetical protein
MINFFRVLAWLFAAREKQQLEKVNFSSFFHRELSRKRSEHHRNCIEKAFSGLLLTKLC